MLLRSAAAALQQLAHAPRFLGGQIGTLGVLQTWSRDLRYPPHVHFLVPALALAPDGKRWLVGKGDFLVHVKPLAQLIGAKFRVGLGKRSWLSKVSRRAWMRLWLVDCRGVGSGAAALKYLAACIFRIALSNNRIERLANDKVTFRYIDGKTGERKRETLEVDAFIGRFLAQVLPKGLVKVRYYGLLCPSKRHLLKGARSVLALQLGATAPQSAAPAGVTPAPVLDVQCCPSCGQPMQLVKTLQRQWQHKRPPVRAGEPTSRGPPRWSVLA